MLLFDVRFQIMFGVHALPMNLRIKLDLIISEVDLMIGDLRSRVDYMITWSKQLTYYCINTKTLLA